MIQTFVSDDHFQSFTSLSPSAPDRPARAILPSASEIVIVGLNV
jgi:hypothetical protein